MKTQQLEHNDQIVHDVWGNACLECDCKNKPHIHSYNLKNEQVMVLSCPICDFTIVVVEVEKLSNPYIQDEISEKDNAIIATHQLY